MIDEQEAEIIRLIFSMCANGYTYSFILEALRTNGMKTRTGIDFKTGLGLYPELDQTYEVSTKEIYTKRMTS